jgi:aspartyl-tRNA(Asn)/glutamyl-tRNA(Gln) amidotransferase subunit A
MMRNLTRREALQTGAAAAVTVTAILNPRLGTSESAREGNSVGESELVPTSAEEICFMEATTLVDLLRTKKISSVEVMKAHLSQIAWVNAKVNAMVTLSASASDVSRGFRRMCPSSERVAQWNM